MQVSEIADSLSAQQIHDMHQDALDRTGFWGAQGAGCIFLAKDTGRIGIVHRGPDIQQPLTWGTIGGAIDPAEDPETAVVRECEEEVGYSRQPGDELVPLDVFVSGTFRYTTFLYVVETEFEAQLNWEAIAFRWFNFGDWPSPLHFGIRTTLAKPEPVAIIEKTIARFHPQTA